MGKSKVTGGHYATGRRGIAGRERNPTLGGANPIGKPYWETGPE